MRKARPLTFAEGHTFTSLPWLYFPEWEAEERAVVCRQLGTATAFVDIGANHGFYTALARHMGMPTIAVEPLPSNLKLLRRNANGATIIAAAVGAKAGSIPIFGDADTASALPNWTNGTPATTAPMITLDSLKLTGRPLIKIDVEGFEDQVLDGATKTLALDAAWLIETLPTTPAGARCPAHDRVFEIMDRAGYQEHPVSQRGNWLFTKSL